MSVRQQMLDSFAGLLRRGIGATGGQHAARIQARLVEQLSPVVSLDTPAGSLKFFCPSTLPVYRAQTLLTKEPETIAWIESFAAGDVLWDVGANVGSYSIYAGARGIRTLAFEPSAANYFLLNRNVQLNGLHQRVSALCIALSEEPRLAALHMQTTELGGALSSFAEPVDWQGRGYTATFEQAMVGFDIDGFIRSFNPPFPTHLKIDVDGREDKVVAGARQTLADPRLRSVLIELDGGREEYTSEVIHILKESGLRLSHQGHAHEIDGNAAKYYLYVFER